MNASHLKRRILEIIPGGLVWATFIAAFVVSFAQPLWAIYFVILFDLYWVLRVLYFIIFLVYSWMRYRNALKVKWSEELQTNCPDWRDYWQLIFLPTYKEGTEIVETTLDALLLSHYAPDRMIVVLPG